LRHDRSGRLPLRAEHENGQCQAWLSHEWDFPLEGSLSVELVSASGAKRRIHSGKIRLAPNRSSKVWSAKRSALGIKDPASQCLVVRFSAQGLERRAILYFERPRRLQLQDPKLSLAATHSAELSFVRIRATHLARAVELGSNVPGQFSDNGFDLLPGETRDIVFSPAKAGAKPVFHCQSLNAIALKRS
jgi:hypothetical protein